MADWDLQAFRDFNIEYGRRFAAFFRRRGLSQAEAEDLAASCVTDIAIRVPQFTEQAEGSFQAWVWTLARGALADWWRKHRPSQSLSVDVSDTQPDPDEEAVQALHEALGRLSERDRDVIELRDLGSEPNYDEIATRLDITKGAAKARHRRAVERLKTLLEQDTRIQVFLERTKPRRRAAGTNDRPR
jgi:RNA polymerase sigma factor (sigma-70 family)